VSTDDEPFGLWDDYVLECDEHLSAARQVLLGLDVATSGPIDRGQLDTLFRNFHSLKGLSGLAGVRMAEQTAHLLEGYLDAIRKGHATLGAEGAGLLFDGARIFEEIIAGHPEGRPPPDTTDLTSRVRALLSDGGEAAVIGARAGTAVAGPVWRVVFTPSSDLAARGVNVNSVRERLKGVGNILRSEPSQVAGGIRFTFYLTGPTSPNEFAGWAEDGLSVEPESVPTPSTVPLAPSSVVRVDLGRLDDLMRTVGELVLSRARLEIQFRRAALPSGLRREIEEVTQTMDRQLRTLREEVIRVRLVPVRDLFQRMRLVAREAAKEAAKDVELVLEGERTEVDKFVVERVADPLMHLVRNAVSHGLELPTARAAAGKPLRGRVSLRAAATGGTITIEVEDDGRGVDTEAVFAQATEAGLVPPNTRPDPAGVLDLICSPGFSTSKSVDLTSGRGVGMDVVRRAVEDLGGFLDLTSRAGKGAQFTLRLPLTLAIADVVTVKVGDQTYALPQAVVREIIEVEPREVTVLENNELVRHRGGVLPLLRLGDFFAAPRPTSAFPALVVGEGAHAVAMAADRALGLREVVVRPLADPLIQVPGVSGATELGDGRAVLILDIIGLTRHARSRQRVAVPRIGG
jgi:two-component system chemotaxis sensor kinase CheA